MNKKPSARAEVAAWIDDGVIADELVATLQRNGMLVTVPNMKGLWLAALEDVHSMLRDVPDSRLEKEAAAIEKAEELKKTVKG
jgi:hypothetical protein